MQDLLGKVVKYDVLNNVGLVIIKANITITQEHLDVARRHRINPLDIVLDNGIVFATSASNPMSPINLMTRHVVDESIRLFRTIEFTKEIPIAQFEKTIIPTVQKISNDPNIFNLFEAIKAKDDYTHQHNIGVAVLATLIGKWLNINNKELEILSLAAILHDVGKVKLPMELLHKAGKLTKDEYKVVQQHTVLGYQLLRDTPDLPPQVAIVALQHHEREDGSGYPLGLPGKRLDYFSKIITVADIFHAMSSKRPYHDPIPFHSIIKEMKQGIFGELDPHIVSVFLKNITQKLVGTQVILMDGRIGEIVYINPHDDSKPMIKVDNQFIDLSKENHLHIKDIIS